MQDKFECWALVELFGHKKMAGKIQEQDIAGIGFIRIDVPETKGMDGFTKYLSPSSIYGITPVDEEHARAAVQAWCTVPVDPFDVRELAEKMADRIVSKNRQIECDREWSEDDEYEDDHIPY